MREVVLDTETTGLSTSKGHRIIEIGAVELIDRRLTGNNFQVYINPERSVDPGAYAVHGIGESFLADKPVFAEVMQDFLDYLQNSQVIIHNAPFDLEFLNYELRIHNKTQKKIEEYCSVVDTLKMARKKHPGQRNSLDALCKRYEIDNSNRELHGALLDSEILAQVYLFMTGGQSTLFAEGAPQESNKPTISSAPLQQQTPTKVIKASDEELALHEAYMTNV